MARKRCAVLATVLMVQACCGLPVLAKADNLGVPDSGIELGLGWNAERSEIIQNRCIEFAPVQEKGQTITMELNEVSDTSEVMERLNVSASMSVRSMFGSGSARSEFAQNNKVKSSATSLLVKATVNNGVLFAAPPKPMRPIRQAFPVLEEASPSLQEESHWFSSKEVIPQEIQLTSKAREILGNASKTELKAFEHYCGTGYVSAIYSGAELLALMSINEKDQTKKQNTKSSIKASFSAWGVDGSGSAAAATEKNASNTSKQVEVNYTQIGGSGGIIPTSKEDFFKKLHKLPEEALKGPEFHSMDVTPYSELPAWPLALETVSSPSTLEDSLSNYYWTLSSIDYLVLEALDQATNKETLEALQDQINSFRGQIYQQLQKAYQETETTQPVKNRGFWDWFTGLFTWLFPEQPAPVLLARQELEAEMQSLHQELVDFSFGYDNPNLIKLRLSVPGKDKATGKEKVDYYIKQQTRRICSNDPLSSECLSNAELTKLAEKLDQPAGKEKS